MHPLSFGGGGPVVVTKAVRDTQLREAAAAVVGIAAYGAVALGVQTVVGYSELLAGLGALACGFAAMAVGVFVTERILLGRRTWPLGPHRTKQVEPKHFWRYVLVLLVPALIAIVALYIATRDAIEGFAIRGVLIPTFVLGAGFGGRLIAWVRQPVSDDAERSRPSPDGLPTHGDGWTEMNSRPNPEPHPEV